MNILSLFDGMSCGQLAITKELGIEFDGVKNKYFAAEIKPIAIKLTQHNFPNTIQVGNVKEIDLSQLPKIDLLIGGSPCQDLSIANSNRLGLKGNKSSLFWEYVRILKEVKPKYFLLENVEMPVQDLVTITETLGVNPVNINSNLVSAQNRNRYYWTNIKGDEVNLFGESVISQPKNKNVKLQDILEYGYTDKLKHSCLNRNSGVDGKQEYLIKRNSTTGMITLIYDNEDCDEDEGVRTVTQKEMERLQTVPEGYTSILNKRHAGDLLGDGWTIDVIRHIIKNLKEDSELL